MFNIFAHLGMFFTLLALASSARADFNFTEYTGPSNGSSLDGSLSPSTGDTYSANVGVVDIYNNLLLSPNNSDSVINGETELVGSTLGDGSDIFSSDRFTPLGNGAFEIELSLFSEGELTPDVMVGGQPADQGLVIFGAANGGDSIELADHTITLATLELFDANGNSLSGPFDITFFSEFNPGTDKGWSGDLGVILGAGSAGVGVAEIVLKVQGVKSTVVPEPATAALIAATGLLLVYRRGQ